MEKSFSVCFDSRLNLLQLQKECQIVWEWVSITVYNVTITYRDALSIVHLSRKKKTFSKPLNKLLEIEDTAHNLFNIIQKPC